jgi:hypothetical protein
MGSPDDVKQKGKTVQPSPSPDPSPSSPPPAIRARPALSNAERAARAERAGEHRKAYGALGDPKGINIDKVITIAGIEFSRDRIWTNLVFELAGHETFTPHSDLVEALWSDSYVLRTIPVRYDKFAKGYLNVYRTDAGLFNTVGPELLAFSHPALPQLRTEPIPALQVQFVDSRIEGKLVLAKSPAGTGGFLPAVKEIRPQDAAEMLGLDDLQKLEVGDLTNGITAGVLRFELAGLRFLLDGVFPGEGKFTLSVVDPRKDPLEATAAVEGKGVDPKKIELTRDENGQISAEAELEGHLDPLPGHRLEGKLKAVFAGGAFDIDGTLTYKWSGDHPKVSGTVNVRLTDLATARGAIRQRLGKFAPPDPAGETAPNGLALWGEGHVDFTISEWLTGGADVIVDPDGFITVIGQLRPTRTIQLFKKYTVTDLGLGEYPGKFVELATFLASHRIGLAGSVSLTPGGAIGPGILDSIEVQGVFSTYPKERLPTQFSIQGTFSVGAYVTLTLAAEVGVSAGGVVGAYLTASGTAILSAHAEATPKIGRAVPPEGGDAAFFISGSLVARASLDLRVKVGVKAEIDTPFWKEEVSYDIVDKTFNLGSMGVRVTGTYFLGQDGGPKLSYAIDKGFDNQRWTHKAIHRSFDSPKETAASKVWQGANYPAAEERESIVPAEGLPDVPVTTETLAAGGLEPHESAPGDESTAPGAAPPPPTTPPTPPPPPPGTTPPPPGTTPPPPTTTPPPPTTTPPTPTPGTTPPPPGSPPPPSPPGPTSPGPLEPLRLTLTMLDRTHTLLLWRMPPPRIVMEPTPEALRYKIRVTEIVVGRQLEQAQQGSQTIRTVTELEQELRELARLAVATNAVEDFVRRLPDPYRVPPHVSGFETLADDLESYGTMFRRPELFDESYLRGVPSPVPPGLPRNYWDSQVLRQLERAQPNRVRRLIDDYNNRYLPKFNAATNQTTTKTAMGEREYLEMRARFILGMQVEEDTLVLYSRLSGISVTKNNYPVDILERGTTTKERGRKPDFFILGTIIGDVKNVGDQDYDSQMRDNFRIADADQVRISPGFAGTPGGRILNPATPADVTPRIDLIVRVPWHPRGPTVIAPALQTDITGRGNQSQIWELIDDPIA